MDVIRAYKMDRTMKPSWLTADEGFSIPISDLKLIHVCISFIKKKGQLPLK